MKEIKSKFAIIHEDDFRIKLLNEKPKDVGFETVLEDVEIVIDENNILQLKAMKWNYDFNLIKVWNYEDDKKAVSEDIRYGYKTIFDIFNNRKKPYIKKGWYRLEKSIPYNIILNKWFLEL